MTDNDWISSKVARMQEAERRRILADLARTAP